MDITGVQIPLGVDLSGLDKGLAAIPAHVVTSVAKVKPIKITADLSGISTVASQAAATVTNAGQAAIVKVNAVGERVAAQTQRAAIAASTADPRISLDSFGGVANFRQVRGAGGFPGGGGGGGGTPRSGLAETVHEAMSVGGMRSTTGHLLELAMSGGVVGFAAREADAMLGKLVELKQGTLGWRDAMRSIPLFGTGMDIGDKLRYLVTGMTTTAQQAEIAATAMKRVMDAIEGSAKVIEHLGATVKGFQEAGKEAVASAMDRANQKLMSPEDYTKWKRGEDASEAKKAISEKVKVDRKAVEKATSDEVAAMKSAFLKNHPNANYGTPEEVAQAAKDEIPVNKAIHARKVSGEVQLSVLDSEAKSAADQIDKGVVTKNATDDWSLWQDQLIKAADGTDKFMKAFLSRGAAEIQKANKAIAGAEDKLAMAGMSEGERFMFEIKKRTNDSATLAAAQKTADKIDAAATEKDGKSKVAKDLGEALKYALPQAIKFGSGEMASWQSDLQQFVAKQMEGGGGNPDEDSKNLETIASAFGDSNQLVLKMGGA